jgi:hypothetical protein
VLAGGTLARLRDAEWPRSQPIDRAPFREGH